jgi:type II secretory pathway pseudopilin PulG
MSKKTVRDAFTLVETIAASFILCVAVMMLVAGSTRALSRTRLNRQRERAAALIDKHLAMIDTTGIEEFIKLGRMEGEFDEAPGYYWKVVTGSRSIDYLYEVTITVGWIERGRPYSLSVDTMLDGTGTLLGFMSGLQME